MNKLNITPDDIGLIKDGVPFTWLNSLYQKNENTGNNTSPSAVELYSAEQRLKRFSSLLKSLFPALEASDGLIESPLLKADKLNNKINPVGGTLYLKADYALPVAGSIKARGGIHEVLFFAESLAKDYDLIKSEDDDYRVLLEKPACELFAKYSICVGSTGNLGLSIGIIGAALGFNAVVHMSSDAKQWKKELLRERGVEVVEYDADYSAAVEAGRLASDANPFSYFVDDERSPHLFMGYGVAALRLKNQLKDANIQVNAEHPLFVYLPAGVGGAPGGITFGLKQLFGDDVHCFFAEPVQAPCMLIGMSGEPNSGALSVNEFGLNIDTDADGLAVGRASEWVCDSTRNLLSGVYTATDEQIYQQLYLLKILENIEVEPSAAISCLGPKMLNTKVGRAYLKQHQLLDKMENSVHISWLTGGSLVPATEYEVYFDRGRESNEAISN